MMKKRGRNMGLLTLMGVFLLVGFLSQGCTDTQSTNVAPGGAGSKTPALNGDIMGMVVNMDNEAVEGAVVRLGSRKTKTNSEGHYELKDVPVSGNLCLTCAADQAFDSRDIFGDGIPYLITVEAEGYVTTHTAALLDYQTLGSSGAIVVSSDGGDSNSLVIGDTDGGCCVSVIGDLMTTAVTANMRRPIAVVQGKVVNRETAEGLGGVLATLSLERDSDSEGRMPEPSRIWEDQDSTWAYPNPYATSESSCASIPEEPNFDCVGNFEFDNVPEGRNSYRACYQLTLTRAGFQLDSDMTANTTVCVGHGGTLAQPAVFWADADLNDYIHTPYGMMPAGSPTDQSRPYVTATSLPVGGEIAFANRNIDPTVTFNEPMNTSSCIPLIDAPSFKSPGPVPIEDVSWSADGKTMTMGLADPLPGGVNLVVDLTNCTDVAGNPYNGLDPSNRCDFFTRNESRCPSGSGTSATLQVSGDPCIMAVQAPDFIQVLLPPDPNLPPLGGNANRVPQANNLNMLDAANDLLGLDAMSKGGDGNGIVGSYVNEADTIITAWAAAQPATECPASPASEGGAVRQYVLYAEYRSGGIPGGLPVAVNQTAKSADPEQTLATSLTQVNDALPASLPDISDDNEGGLLYVDNGFTFNMAVIAMNADNQPGPYSNAVEVEDNVPITVADQGWGWDWPAIGTMEFDTNFITNAGNPVDDTWVPVNGVVSGQTGYAIRPVTSGSGEMFDVDLDALDPDEDGRYNESDWNDFAGATGLTLEVAMNEDVDPSLDPLPLPQLNDGSGATVLGASLLGIGSSRMNVAVSMQGVALLAPGDTLSFVGYQDESGNLANTSPVDAALIFADRLQPLIIAGATADNAAGEPDTIGLTLIEPPAQEGAGDATNINNWMYGAMNVLDTVSVTDSAVTITAGSVGDEDGQYAGIYEGYDKDTPGGGEPDYSDPGEFPPTNSIYSALWDLNGNLSANYNLAFIVVDGIAPRLSTVADIQTDWNGQPINNGSSLWDVGDAGPQQVVLDAVFTEPVLWDLTGDEVLDSDDANGLGIEGQVSDQIIKYSAVANDDPPNIYTPRFVFNINPSRTVEGGDSFSIITARDRTGNNVDPSFNSIVLDGTTLPGLGYDIE